jgi:hypothetical protein
MADEEYRPLSRRRRLLIVALALSTAFTVLWMLSERPGGPKWKGKPPRADAPRCAAGQTRDCVGGQADIIVVPPAAAASAGR